MGRSRPVMFEGQTFDSAAALIRAYPAYRSYVDLFRQYQPQTIIALERLIHERHGKGRARQIHAARTGQYAAVHANLARAGKGRKQE